MRLSPELRKQLLEQAQDAAPAEACGLIGGVGIPGSTGAQATTLYPATNVAGIGRYEIAATDQFGLLRKLEAAGEQLLAVYHSHVFGPAYPSAGDIEMATDPQVIHLIVSIADPDRAVFRGFRITELGVGEHAITD